MDVKKILVLLIVSVILAGCVSAAVTDFKIDSAFTEVYSNDDYAIYADANNTTGISVYKALDTDAEDDSEPELFDEMLHEDGAEYLMSDEDMIIKVNADNTANFTDNDNGITGISESVDQNGEKYIIVVWAEASTSTDLGSLMSIMDQFNKDNNVTPSVF